MKDIINLIDELIFFAREDDFNKDPRSLIKRDGGECFLVHHLQILKEEIKKYDNDRLSKGA